jgi:hypothetical protein
MVIGKPLYKPNPASQQFLHHALLELAGFIAAGFEGGEFSAHIGEDDGDGGLFFQCRR